MYINVNNRMLINMDKVLTMQIVAKKKEVALRFFMSNPADKHQVQVVYDTMKQARVAYDLIMTGISHQESIVEI